MNVHGLIAGVIGTVNPPTPVMVQQCTGYATAADYTQAPTYAAAFGPVNMQVQPLTTKQIEHVDSLNLQGIFRSVYTNVQLRGADRKSKLGGDLLTFGGDTWLVVEVQEAWTQAGWSHAIVSKQVA